MSIITVDIDGILNYYPECWVTYINQQKNRNFISKEEALVSLGVEQYRDIKKQYRNSSYKATLPVNKDAVEMLQYFKSLGYEIIIATSRPIFDTEFPNLFSLTNNWLTINKIPFNQLMHKKHDDSFFSSLPKIEFHIEDELEYAKSFAKYGIKTYLYTQKSIVEEEHIIPFRSFKQLRESFTQFI